MNFACQYSDGSTIEIEMSGNPSFRDVIRTQVFEEEFDYFLENIDFKIKRIKAFKYNQDNSCKYIEFEDVNGVSQRFHFHIRKHQTILFPVN